MAEHQGLTELEADAMRHALGLKCGKRSYRNYYAAEPDSDDDRIWTGLVLRGLASLALAPDDDGGLWHYNCYVVTEAGRRELGLPFVREWTKP